MVETLDKCQILKEALVSLFLSFLIWFKLCWNNLFASSSIIKLREKRTSALNLQVCSSNFKYSRGLNVIFHDHMDSREQAAAMIINKYFDENFDFMKKLSRAGQSLGGHHSKPLKVDKLTRGLSFSGLPFQSANFSGLPFLSANHSTSANCKK